MPEGLEVKVQPVAFRAEPAQNQVQEGSWISADGEKPAPENPPAAAARSFPFHRRRSDDSIISEGLEQHRVLDIAEDPADAAGVCGAGEVWVQRLPLLPLVPIGGLLLVQLTDVVLGVLGVSLFTCRGRENQFWRQRRRRHPAVVQKFKTCFNTWLQYLWRRSGIYGMWRGEALGAGVNQRVSDVARSEAHSCTLAVGVCGRDFITKPLLDLQVCLIITECLVVWNYQTF